MGGGAKKRNINAQNPTGQLSETFWQVFEPQGVDIQETTLSVQMMKREKKGIKISPEMEVALHYKLLTLLTWFILFILFKLLNTA